MSFILDALRRAETRRGHVPRTTPSDSLLGEVAEKPSSLPAPRWIAVILVGLVAIAALAMNLLNSRDAAPLVNNATADNTTIRQAQSSPFPAIAPDTPLAEVVTPATREIRPLGKEARSVAVTTGGASPAPTSPAKEITPERFRSQKSGSAQRTCRHER